MFSISSEAIDIDALKRDLRNDAAGACVDFEGWVRNTNEGKAINRLEYEGYEAVAVKEGKKVLEEALERFDIIAAHCVHRVGDLAIGDMAVWAGVVAGHRGEAFDACRYAIETLKDTDLVVVHVEATDEASHEGDAQAKVAALEQIDREIVGPVHQFLKSQGDYRLLVSPDHPTFLRTKTHAHGYVPFTLCGHNVNPDGLNRYDEATAAKTELVLQGHELMPMFVEGRG